MATLLEALSDGSFDMQNKRDLSSGFARELTSYRDKVVNDYVKHKIDLNKSIANLAKSKNFNDDQISRIIEEVNNQVYLIEYSKLKEQPERNVTFDIAMLPKIKSIMDGSYKEPVNNDQVQKTASEYGCFEKIASEEVIGDSRNFFNSYNVHACPLSFSVKEDENKIHLSKIAKSIVKENENLEKLAKDMDRGLNLLGMAMVKYSQLGADVNSIYNNLYRQANLTENQMELIKIATETRLNDLKEVSPMPKNFNIEFSLNKVAEEDFSLGKFSIVKTASFVDNGVPSIIADKTPIKGMNDLVKIAKEVMFTVDEYVDRTDKYNKAIDKVASLQLGDNAVDKLYKGFFKDSLSVANTEKVALDTSLALRNATKELDGILAKNKKALHIKPIPKIESFDSQKQDNFSKLFNKAVRGKGLKQPKLNSGVSQNKNYNSFNLQ